MSVKNETTSQLPSYTLQMPIFILRILGSDSYLLYQPQMVPKSKRESVPESIIQAAIAWNKPPAAPAVSAPKMPFRFTGAPSGAVPRPSGPFHMRPPFYSEEKKESQAEVDAKKRQEMEAELAKFSLPVTKKESKRSINSILTSVIVSMCGMRLKLVREVAKNVETRGESESIKAAFSKVVLPQNEILSFDKTKLTSINTAEGERKAKTIELIIDNSVKQASKLNSVPIPSKAPSVQAYTLPCGHKVGEKYFLSYAKKLKENMETGPLQFKCPYDCLYVLNDKDLAILLGHSFSSITDYYDVIIYFLLYSGYITLFQ